LEEDECP